MIKISREEFIKRYDALPENLRQAILSDESVDMLWTIGGAHHLSEDRIGKVAGVIGYIILGLVHLEDLVKEIVIEVGVDRRLAEEIAREIKLKILNPLIPQLQQLYHYGSTGSPQAGSAPLTTSGPAPSTGTAAAPVAPPQPAIIKPVFAPGGQGAPLVERSRPRGETRAGQDTPFILHEEQKEIEQARPIGETLVRPSFYEAGASSKEQVVWTEKPQTARLEIGPSAGLGQEERREPQVGKTETPPIRIVHYSGPQTPVDPFGPSAGSGQEDISQPPEKPSKQPPPPRDIHPENIVDLKDLPK